MPESDQLRSGRRLTTAPKRKRTAFQAPAQSLTTEVLARWVDEFRACHDGKFPSNRSGVIPGANRSWRSVDAAMRIGGGGWPEKISLLAWLDRQYPARLNRIRMTPPVVRHYVDDYRARHDGAFPTQRSGRISDTEKTWGTLWMSVPNRRDGWPAHITFGTWLDEQYPERIAARAKHLSPDIVRAWVERFRAAHNGKFPSTVSGPIPDTDKTWGAVDSAMTQCNAGWTQRTSLAVWLDEQYPERVRQLTPELLRRWVEDYRDRHEGRFPTLTSGQIAGTNKTWAAVGAAMKKGFSGWTQKTSLALWLDQQYPGRIRAVGRPRDAVPSDRQIRKRLP